MVYFEKKYPAPSSLEKCSSYREDDVLNKLYDEFNNKCYICESKGIEAINIEHFVPHKKINNIRKFNWSNLFWACSHCNQIKSDIEPLLNCTIKEDKVDINIRYYIDDDLVTNKIIIEKLVDNIQTENTVKLLNNIYGGTTTTNKFQAGAKRNKLYDELCYFSMYIQQYTRTEDTKRKIQLLETIKYELSNESAFTAFKRWIIRDNKALKSEFRDILE
jgi:hypothetical protein